MPTVSVVMCTYNGDRYLRAQMDSILGQDYPISEIIVQDDGSTDDTYELLKSYRNAHPHLFRLFKNNERLGFNRNFHTAMLRATSDYIAISDQDDVWFSDKIRRQVEAIGSADVCYSDYYRDAVLSGHLHVKVSPPSDMVSLLFANVIPGHSMLVRSGFLQNDWAWRDDFYYDWWFLVNAILRGGGVVHVAEPLNWHRPHANSAIAQLTREKGGRTKPFAPWCPYVEGWAALRQMRRQRKWQMFYQYVAAHSSDTNEPVAHRLSTALLDEKHLMRLCCLCWKHRSVLCPTSRGVQQSMRAFCRPAIYAYGNATFSD